MYLSISSIEGRSGSLQRDPLGMVVARRPLARGFGLLEQADLAQDRDGVGVDLRVTARAAVEETGGRGLLLAPGCSVSPRVREVNLEAMATAVAA